MKLYFSPTSPFVRKCLATAHELKIGDQLHFLPASSGPVKRDQTIIVSNPLGKVPTLITDDGVALYDSRVICEYLNSVGKGHLFPAEGAARWACLTLQALADGMMDAALLARYETALRPDNLQWNDWRLGQLDKIETSLSNLEKNAASLSQTPNIGLLTLGCALWYLDLRFPELAWRGRFPAVAAWAEIFLKRESMSKAWALQA
jgi:glutathione S-transferase